VSLSYRRAELARVRRQNRLRIDDAIRSGKVRALMPSEIVEIEPGHVRFTAGKQESRVENDAVIVQIGGTAPSELLAKFGIQLVTKHGEA
jgi:thioredoxin reductase